MTNDEMWPALAAAPGAPVRLATHCGREIDVASVHHYCGVIILATAEPVNALCEPTEYDDFIDVLEEFSEDVTADNLRAVLEASPHGMADIAEMLALLHDAEIEDAKQLRAALCK